MRRRLRRRPALLRVLTPKSTIGKALGSHDSGALRVVPLGKAAAHGFRAESGIRPRSCRAGGYAIPFLRSCRGTRRARTLRSSLLRCGERPGRHPDVASGGYSYPAPARLGALRGGAVSSVVTSGCPKRSEGGFPVGTRRSTAPPQIPFLVLTPYLKRNKRSVSPRAQPSQSRR